MLTIVRRNGLATATILAALTLALVAFALRPGMAGAQTVTGEDTEVLNGLQIAPVNGYFDFGAGTGTNAGIVGAQCSGEFPLGGPNIPAQVVTHLTSTSTQVRVLHNNGTPLTGSVVVVCTIDFGAITTPAAVRNAFAH